ncbi:unnamed protein product [Sphenostylis stenocarpa]|uniref:Uncharacterized protein n=1 Tax=Sphenostylis stenocarpa TaxID=92480 RepID=A0AA86RKR5_9FABA|nr:unnamed protein product [Sphenostylis stenocarpa]
MQRSLGRAFCLVSPFFREAPFIEGSVSPIWCSYMETVQPKSLVNTEGTPALNKVMEVENATEDKQEEEEEEEWFCRREKMFKETNGEIVSGP